jgi:hypothetical protein
VECGQRPEENQVSSVSSSWRTASELQDSQRVGVSIATVWCWQASQYQTGMRWPHQIWRLMHQSRMFSIHCR